MPLDLAHRGIFAAGKHSHGFSESGGSSLAGRRASFSNRLDGGMR